MPQILIVDDEKENREAMQRALIDENPDWEIFVASTRAEAITILESQVQHGSPIDVVLTDLVMEAEQSGMDVLSEARKIDPQVMAILFTAKERSLNRYAAFDYGAFDVVEKNIRGTAAIREINIKTRAALRYREWSTQINFLRRYFDPGVFEIIKHNPEILTIHQQTVTVCFWDIRGFSLLCEILKAKPTLIAGFLKDYCEAAARIIFQHGGILDKFIGDGVMALFGVLDSDEDEGKLDARAATQAAIQLRSEFTTLLDKWTTKWKLHTPHNIEIGLGCGIHTGSVLVGNVGTEFRDQFTALGPDVNFAARIQGRAQAGEILLSQSTASRVESTVTLTFAEEIDDVKNIPGKFKLFRI